MVSSCQTVDIQDICLTWKAVETKCVVVISAVTPTVATQVIRMSPLYTKSRYVVIISAIIHTEKTRCGIIISATVYLGGTQLSFKMIYFFLARSFFIPFSKRKLNLNNQIHYDHETTYGRWMMNDFDLGWVEVITCQQDSIFQARLTIHRSLIFKNLPFFL